jgi:hypothetical protein
MKVDDDLKCRERPTSLENPYKRNCPDKDDSDMAQSSISQYEGGGKKDDQGNINEMEKEDSDIDNIDFDNFKGIYFEDDPNRKFQDPDTGCHFEYYDLCKRLSKLKVLRKKLDYQLGLPPESPDDK